MNTACSICWCEVFEPNFFDKKYCKNCFHKEDNHQGQKGPTKKKEDKSGNQKPLSPIVESPTPSETSSPSVDSPNLTTTTIKKTIKTTTTPTKTTRTIITTKIVRKSNNPLTTPPKITTTTEVITIPNNKPNPSTPHKDGGTHDSNDSKNMTTSPQTQKKEITHPEIHVVEEDTSTSTDLEVPKKVERPKIKISPKLEPKIDDHEDSPASPHLTDNQDTVDSQDEYTSEDPKSSDSQDTSEIPEMPERKSNIRKPNPKLLQAFLSKKTKKFNIPKDKKRMFLQRNNNLDEKNELSLTGYFDEILNAKNLKGNFVIKEIIKTESEYVKSISHLLSTYLSKLQNTITPADINIIFSNILWIYNINSEFENKLKKIESSKSPLSKLIRLLEKYCELFKSYGKYSSGYGDAMKQITLLRKENSEFASTLDKLEQQDEKGWKIASYLIAPIQRICRYPLLLRELIQNTDKSDEHYDKLIKVHQKIEEIVHTVNEIKRKRESLDLMNVVNKRLSIKGFVLVKPNRILLHSCEQLVQNNPKKKPKMTEIYIFNDIITHLKKSKSTNDEHSVIELKYCDLEFSNTYTDYTILVRNSQWKDNYMFKIFCQNEENFKNLKSIIDSVIRKKKIESEYISEGLFQQDNKNYPVKYTFLSNKNPERSFQSACLSKKKVWLVENNKVEVFSCVNKNLLSQFELDEGGQSEVTRCVFGGSHVFMGMSDGKVFYSKVNKSELNAVLLEPLLHSVRVTCLFYCEKDELFVSCDSSGCLLFWRFVSGKLETVNEIKLDGSPDLVFVHSENLYVVVNLEGEKSKLYKINQFSSENASTVENVLDIDGHVHSACSAAGKVWVAVDTRVVIYDFNEDKPKELTVLSDPHKKHNVTSILEHNNFVFTFGLDNSIRIWGSKEFESLKIIDIHQSTIIFTSSDKENMFTVSKNGEIIKWLFQFD